MVQKDPTAFSLGSSDEGWAAAELGGLFRVLPLLALHSLRRALQREAVHTRYCGTLRAPSEGNLKLVQVFKEFRASGHTQSTNWKEKTLNTSVLITCSKTQE